jgi:two-component system, chemotaxis family, CheB/CheR fusion protein
MKPALRKSRKSQPTRQAQKLARNEDIGTDHSPSRDDGKPVVKEGKKITPGADAPVFPVVGIGASAGGLEAVTQLLKALPPEPGMAFVLVPHLDPTHESAMTELLSRATQMRVFQVYDGIRLKPNHVYVIPPNKDMTVSDGALRLVKREHPAGLHMPIDIFLRSLASELRRNAIGVILSGTASDGTLGVAAIKSEGGITFAQDSKSAKYDGMPNNAIASGCIDLVLAPEKIAEELTRIRHHPYVADPHLDAPASEHSPQMSRVFRLLKQVCKVDFSAYKPATIRRRVLRRMALRRIENLEDYTEILQRDRGEVEALYQDILINVTSFFRDPAVFQALRETVYPAILKGRSPADTIRIWVPGCSTGEEAYSHAISLLEYVTEIRADISVQIFATDLSLPAVRRARLGSYRESIRADVSPERLKRFFNKVEGGYQISKAVRDMCVFANQNVFNDPPFSHVDLLSCRNVLIYLSQTLQKRVIPIFHYALRSGGFLMVGNTEGLVGTGVELFELVHKKHKIYRKKAVPSPVAFGIPAEHFDARIITPVPVSLQKQEPVITPVDLQREADRLLLTRYVPAAAVVSSDLELLQTRGQASQYLEVPPGKASLNLLKMIKPGLLFELQNAIEEAKRTAAPFRKESLPLEMDGNLRSVSLEVIPFQLPQHSGQSFIVVFEDGTADRAKTRETIEPKLEEEGTRDKLIFQLRRELLATKEYQQSIIEALEASNEELQSANEEIQSGNEELQSTNEELQTSKEELESANEELNTVNEEMQHRNYELAQANSDLMNLLTSVNIPVVMLGSDLTIRRVTPNAEELLGLHPADVGRPLVHIKLKMDIPDFEHMALQVMRDACVRQREFQEGKTWYRLRITPYRTADNQTEGVLAALFDITDFKNQESQQLERRSRK